MKVALFYTKNRLILFHLLGDDCQSIGTYFFCNILCINAWVKVIGQNPRRLSCYTWHVIRKWNIQGKNKIKYPDMKKGMKCEMKRILNETKAERFDEVSF
jgi:hypothetical protein